MLLPPTDLTEDETITLVLRDILGIPTAVPEPEWVESLVAPGQMLVDARLNEIDKQCEELIAEHTNAIAERAAFREPLRLLYDEGHLLEDTVRSVLRSLGAEVESPPKDDPNHEDGWIVVHLSDEVLEGVLEIKATSKRQFTEAGLKQLSEWQHRGRSMRGKDYKPIFVGNASRGLPPQDRPSPYADQWKQTATLQGACAILTMELYAAYVQNEAGRLDREAFWRTLFSTSGPLDAATALGPASEASDTS